MIKKAINLVINFFRHLSDVKFLGQTIFIIIVLLVSYSTAKAIQLNYDVQKRVAEKQKQNEVQKLKNENLKLKIKYLETDEFLELSARRQLGKALPGETVVIIPKEVAMRHTVASTINTDDEIQQKSDENKPTYQKNLEAWRKFLFRH